MQRKFASLFFLVSATAAFATGAAFAADEVGVAERIVNTVTGTVETETRAVETGAAVFRSELLIASSDSRGEISLADGSKVIVAENASVELDDFVIAGNTIESGTIRITKGAFRFISNGEPSPIKFETPLSSIGVRGTVFDLYVAPEGQTRLVVLSGSVRACTLTGRCIVTNRGCDVVEIRGPEEIEEMAFLRSRERGRQEEAEQFHLTENQRQFKAAYRARVGGCNGRAAEEFAAGTARSSADPPPDAPAPTPAPAPAPSDPFSR